WSLEGPITLRVRRSLSASQLLCDCRSACREDCAFEDDSEATIWFEPIGGREQERARAELTELTDTLRDNLNKIVQHGKRADACFHCASAIRCWRDDRRRRPISSRAGAVAVIGRVERDPVVPFAQCPSKMLLAFLDRA